MKEGVAAARRGCAAATQGSNVESKSRAGFLGLLRKNNIILYLFKKFKAWAWLGSLFNDLFNHITFKYTSKSICKHVNKLTANEKKI